MPYKLVGGFLQFVEGKSLPTLFEDEYMRCDDCGKTLPEGDIRCRRCGSDAVVPYTHPGSSLNGGESGEFDKVPEQPIKRRSSTLPNARYEALTEGDDPSPFNFCKNCGGKVKKSVADESEKWNQQGHCGKKCKQEWDGKHFGCCGKAKAIECDECEQAYECIEHGATHLGWHRSQDKK